VLVALLLISGTVAVYYFSLYNQQLATARTYADELNGLNSKYGSVASSYDSLVSRYNSASSNYSRLAAHYNGSVTSLQNLASSYVSSASEFQNLAVGYQKLLTDYNRSLFLLVRTVSVMNTSEPAYQNATRALNALSASYDNLALGYKQIVERHNTLVSNFQQMLKQYQASNNVTLIGQYPEQLRPIPTSLLAVNVLIEAGNGTRHWYNDTQVQAGWNLYITTVVLLNGSVGSTWYPQYGEHFIFSISGRQNTATDSWFLWTYNKAASWQVAQTGADMIPATNGSSFAWTYCKFDQSYQPTCKP
jgi:hypothetical protein